MGIDVDIGMDANANIKAAVFFVVVVTWHHINLICLEFGAGRMEVA